MLAFFDARGGEFGDIATGKGFREWGNGGDRPCGVARCGILSSLVGLRLNKSRLEMANPLGNTPDRQSGLADALLPSPSILYGLALSSKVGHTTNGVNPKHPTAPNFTN